MPLSEAEITLIDKLLPSEPSKRPCTSKLIDEMVTSTLIDEEFKELLEWAASITVLDESVDAVVANLKRSSTDKFRKFSRLLLEIFVSHPYVFRYIYGTKEPLALANRTLPASDLQILIQPVSSLVENAKTKLKAKF